MFGNQKGISPEGLVGPAATIAGGAFLMSPLGIPFFVRGLPRVLLAGIGGFVAGKVADTVVENLGNIISSQKPEENGQWTDEH